MIHIVLRVVASNFEFAFNELILKIYRIQMQYEFYHVNATISNG